MRSSWLMSVVLVISCVSTASAAVIGPSKASTLVSVEAFFKSCSQGGKAFDQTVTAQGAKLDFVILPKKAFVATGLTARVNGVNAGDIADVFINIQNSNSNSNPLVVVSTAPANAAGIAHRQLDAPDRYRLRPAARVVDLRRHVSGDRLRGDAVRLFRAEQIAADRGATARTDRCEWGGARGTSPLASPYATGTRGRCR